MAKVYPDYFDIKLKEYNKYDNLLKSKHEDAFSEIVKNIFEDKYSNYSYTVQNYCYLVSKIVSDMLFIEYPELLSSDTSVQEELSRLWNKLNLQRVCLEGALISSALGDIYIKSFIKSGELKVKLIKPQRVCPVFDLDEEVMSYKVMSSLAMNEKDYVYVQEHFKGIIKHTAYEVNSITYDITKEVPLSVVGMEMDSIEQTGVDEFLITHIPNIRLDDGFFGVSDYKAIESLQESLNRRLTQISRVLSLHSSPVLCLPNGFIDENGKVNVKDLEFVELPENVDRPPEFITWNANLEHAFNEIDKEIDAIYDISDIKVFRNQSAMPESAEALRLRMIRTLALVARKGIYFEEGLKQLFKTLLKLENIYLGTKFNADAEIEVEFSDGIPNIMIEDETNTPGSIGFVVDE